MEKRISKFEDIIGQTMNKSIIMNQLRDNRLSQFIFLYGDSGSGKSSMAELIALAGTCERGTIDPCLSCKRCQDNLEAFRTTGISRNIKKINIGKLINKDDIRKMIHEIFDLQALPGEKTFYILEEVHLLGRNQDMLLEELERIQDNTYVIMCTTNYNDILDTLKTRAKLKLHFKRLSPSECRILIDKLTIKYNIENLSSADKSFLTSVSNCNAREITNFLETFKDEKDLGQTMRAYFSKIDVEVYLNLIEALFKDFPNFIMALDEIESAMNIGDVWSGFHNFMRDAVFYMFGGGVSLFTKNEKEKIKELFSKIPQKKIAKIYKLSHTPAKSQIDVEYNLISIQDILNTEIATKKSEKAEVGIENNTATRNATLKSNEVSKEKLEVKKLDLTDLNNLTFNNETYNLDINM